MEQNLLNFYLNSFRKITLIKIGAFIILSLPAIAE